MQGTTVFLGLIAALTMTAASQPCKPFRSNVAYGLDPAALDVRLSTAEESAFPGKQSTVPIASDGRLPVESRQHRLAFRLERYVQERDGAIRLAGRDANDKRIVAIAPAPYCLAQGAWAKPASAVHAGLTTWLAPDAVERSHSAQMVIGGIPFITDNGEVVMHPLLSVEVPGKQPIGPKREEGALPEVAPRMAADPTAARAPFSAQSGETSAGRRILTDMNVPPTETMRFGVERPVPQGRAPLDKQAVFVLALVAMGAIAFLTWGALGVALWRDPNGKAAQLVSEPDNKASLSRMLAVVGAPVVLGCFLASTIAGVAVVLEGGSFPDTTAYLLAGGTLFLPYLANQGRVAAERAFGPRE